MPKPLLYTTVLIVLAALAYFGILRINDHFERSSAAVIEATLADNTIAQLRLLTQIEEQIENGNSAAALEKLSDAIETYVYILEYCELSRCEKAISQYKRN